MEQILIGKGEQAVRLLAQYGNRHGLVAGATGTGKTVSLLVLAEGFSRLGVPVFMADVKGDVAGLAQAGIPSEMIRQRVAQIGIEGYAQEASPVMFWDLHGQAGHPVRTTISEMGPKLLARMLELNDTQAGTLEIAFKLADDQGLLLLDLDDLRACWGSSPTIARRSRQATAWSAPRRLLPCSAHCYRWSRKVVRRCLASRHWTWTT